MQVFNHQSNLIYEVLDTPKDELKGWDGTWFGRYVSQGVYIYQIEIEFIDGVREVFRGTVKLLL